MNRQRYLQLRIQKLLDNYVKKHKVCPNVETIGYYVCEIKETELQGWEGGRG